MNDAPKVAYKTTDPAIVAAWEATVGQIRDIGNRAIDEAERIGKNNGLMVQRAFGEETFVGLAPVDPTDPPQGWRHVRGQFEPRIGKAGDDARKWLASIQRPSLRKVLSDLGLPQRTNHKYGFLGTPGLVMHNTTVYAIYKGEPYTEPGEAWEQCRPSEFYAAQEDADAAHAMADAA